MPAANFWNGGLAKSDCERQREISKKTLKTGLKQEQSFCETKINDWLFLYF